MKEDVKWYVALSAIFGAVVLVFIPGLNSFTATNGYSTAFLVAYLLFAISWGGIFQMWFLFRNKIVKSGYDPVLILQYITGMTLLWLAGDIIAPPLLVTVTGPLPGIIGQAAFSSDVFIYELLPAFIPSAIRYLMTYIFVPAFMLVISKTLLGRHVVTQELLT